MTDAPYSSANAASLRGATRSPFESQLTQQIWKRGEQLKSEDISSNNSVHGTAAPTRSSSKTRSLSDADRPTPPSPTSKNLPRVSRDDISLTNNKPETPKRAEAASSGLSLQFSPKTSASSTGSVNRGPLSPQLDSPHLYGSPASVLPRHSRGLDFSRACTNLHHSTLAEASPDSSPVVGGRGVSIPNRKGVTGQSLAGSPNNNFNNPWSTSGHGDRAAAISSSVSSVNMFESESSSSDDDDDVWMQSGEKEDAMVTTPIVARTGNPLANQSGAGVTQSPGGDWMNSYSPGSLMNFRRARLRNGRSRHSSSSASGNSSKPSPGPLSPPVLKSIETSGTGYFNKDLASKQPHSRRESLTLGTRDLHLSDLSDDTEGRYQRGNSPSSGSTAGVSGADGPRGVIRRAVTRRGNLLPKTKNFARIRALLFEEGAPIDSEAKREAEVIRQVRESDTDVRAPSPSFVPPPLPATSPGTTPQELAVDTDLGSTESDKPATTSFSRQAIQNSGGTEFWNSFDERYRTPPPGSRNAGSICGDDVAMETPPSGIFGHRASEGGRSQSSMPHPSAPFTAGEASRKVGKRRRDDDLDPNSFKRRAVSPGMSVQSSPILPQSPMVKDGSQWTPAPKSSSGGSQADRGHGHDGASGNGHHGPLKRVGLQGMTETSDGLMNMSIE